MLYSYIQEKQKPWLTNLSRSREKKKQTEKGNDDEETTAPFPRFLMNQRKKEKKTKQVFKTSGTTKGKGSFSSKIENECAKQRQNRFLKCQHNRFKGSKEGES